MRNTSNFTTGTVATRMMISEPNPNRTESNASVRPLGSGVILEPRLLKKSYGSGERPLPILIDANLSLRRGEMVAIVAPSGAGKSTLLHLLAALDTPTSGTVYFGTNAIETNDEAALAGFRTRAVG